MLQVIIAFIATVVTAVQALLLYTEGKAICFNNGCEIVEQLTTVTPFIFNVAGSLFFLLIFWCLFLGRTGSEYWVRFARIMLLAGLVAEAVLIYFQHSIAGVFCSYCLLILGFVVLLNILCGVRQVFRGTILFSSVLLACFSLDFGADGAPSGPLSEGVIAQMGPTKGQQRHYLFFSKSCSHCERVIDSLKEENSCSVSFSPVETMDDFNFPGAVHMKTYDPRINLGFLRSLSITGIPVLVAQGDEEVRVISGGKKILQYLNDNCSKEQSDESDTGYIGNSSSSSQSYMKYVGGTADQGKDNCIVAEDCDEQLLDSVGSSQVQ